MNYSPYIWNGERLLEGIWVATSFEEACSVMRSLEGLWNVVDMAKKAHVKVKVTTMKTCPNLGSISFTKTTWPADLEEATTMVVRLDHARFAVVWFWPCLMGFNFLRVQTHWQEISWSCLGLKDSYWIWVKGSVTEASDLVETRKLPVSDQLLLWTFGKPGNMWSMSFNWLSLLQRWRKIVWLRDLQVS